VFKKYNAKTHFETSNIYFSEKRNVQNILRILVICMKTKHFFCFFSGARSSLAHVTRLVNTQEKIYIYIYELMTQFSLPISASAATQFSLPISGSAAMQFWLPISGSAATQFSLPISASAATQFLFFFKKINLRSWEGGVKPVLDRPKQG